MSLAHNIFPNTGLTTRLPQERVPALDGLRALAIILVVACHAQVFLKLLSGRLVLHHRRNLGICATFEYLYAQATNEFVFLNSTDRQWDTGIVFDMLPLTSNWDVIVASRINKHYGIIRRFVSWGFNLIPSILFRVRTSDAGAVKLQRREIIQRFTLVSQSPFSEAGRLIRASRAGYRITEFPVETSVRQRGIAHGVRFGLVVGSLIDVLRVSWVLRSE